MSGKVDGIAVGVKLQGIAFGHPKKISVGEVITVPNQYTQFKYALPENIRLARNVAIILSVIELICCIASVGFYIRRRSKVILAIIIFAFVACLWGAYAKIRLSYWGLFGHAAFTIAVMGGFFIYLIVEMCYGVD